MFSKSKENNRCSMLSKIPSYFEFVSTYRIGNQRGHEGNNIDRDIPCIEVPIVSGLMPRR
jgi:hypothetical protein